MQEKRELMDAPLANMLQLMDANQHKSQIFGLARQKNDFFFHRHFGCPRTQQKSLRRPHREIFAAGESGCALMRYAVAEQNGVPENGSSTHCVNFDERPAKSNPKDSF